MAIRILPDNTKAALINNESLSVLHLVKFEKPSNLLVESELPTDYAYITDAFHDVEWGGNTYTAGTLLKVGTVQETIEAKATSINLELSATKLGTYAIATLNIPSSIKGESITITSDLDLFKSGFYPGDQITITNRSDTDKVYDLRIDKLHSNGTTVKATVLSDGIPSVNTSFDIIYSSPEVTTLTSSKSSLNYANYVNRTVEIYRVYVNPADGSWYDPDEPVLLFKGIISKCQIQDGAQGASKVSWNLTSHWGDFVRVQGRLTSDEYHRALSASGVPDTEAALREDYAEDKGFEHAEKALNVTATYTDFETRIKMVRRGGFAGAIGLKKAKEEKYEVERELDLRLNLAAKFLPVVYGVQKIDSIPVFADVIIDKDTNSTDLVATGATTLYTVNALCEGPIGGIYDIYMDDKSLICKDAQDSDARSSSRDDIPCIGRMEAGHVLGSSNKKLYSTPAQDAYSAEDLAEIAAESTDTISRYASLWANNVNFQQAVVSETGIQHRESFAWTDAKNIDITFYAGLDNQEVDPTLYELSTENRFLVQQKYYTGEKVKYWDETHRLLDTAYTVSIDQITAEDGRAPEYKYVVRGKFINCYHYDGTYRSLNDPANADSFKLGDTISVRFPDNSTLSARIIDKFFFYDAFGNKEYRFIIRTGNDTIDAKLKNGEYGKLVLTASDSTTWLMQSDAWNGGSTPSTQPSGTYTLASGHYFSANGSVTIDRTVTQVTNTRTAAQAEEYGVSLTTTTTNVVNYSATLSGLSSSTQSAIRALISAQRSLELLGSTASIFVNIQITTAAATKSIALPVKELVESSGTFIWASAGTDTGLNNLLGGGYGTASISGTANISCRYMPKKDSQDNTLIEDSQGVGLTFKSLDLSNVTTSVVVPKLANGNIDTTATSFLNTNGYLIIINPLLLTENDMTYYYGGQFVVSNTTYGDYRVSTNPAMQLLDYLTNTRYGKGLSLDVIDLDSFKETARACDEQSDVTMLFDKSQVITLGATYRCTYVSGGTEYFKFEGTVSAIDGSNALNQVTFTDVIGKLGRKWQSWKSYEPGDIVWNKDGFAKLITVAGTTTEPTSAFSGSLVLERVGTASTVTVDTSITRITPEGNPVVKTYSNNILVSGYSLYDADEVVYWKYLGWDAQEQRYATRHQTNVVIDTSKPIFDNVNTLLSQFNGLLRYSNGKYYLALKTKSKALIDFDTRIEVISEDDIIGAVKLEDKGISNTYNSITASIIDPSNKFESRNISFFNSVYLKQDKGIPRQGNFGTTAISNYYNARMAVKQTLDESRYGLQVSLTLAPKAYLLLAGELIIINYRRFNWEDKLFRILSSSINADNTVQIVAQEHTDDAYYLDALESSIIQKFTSSEAKPSTLIGIPSGLEATTSDRGGVLLTWTNFSSFNPATHTVQIWRSPNPVWDENEAQLVGFSKSDNYTDQITAAGKTTRYYWIRYAVVQDSGATLKNPKEVYSNYHPALTENGKEGISDGGVDGITLTLTNENASVAILADDSLDFTVTGTTITAYIGSQQLVYDATSPYTDNSFRIKSVTPSTGVTVGTSSNTSNSYSLSGITALSGNTGYIDFVITVRNSLGGETDFTKTQTFTKSLRGADGITTGVLILYQPNTSDTTSPEVPADGLVYTFSGNSVTGNGSWSITKPELTVGQYLWAIQYPYSTTGSSITVNSSNWSAAVVVDSNTKGDTGLKSVQGYLYYEKTTAGAPSTTGIGNTYTISTGKVSGTSINDSGTTNVWKNSPNTQSATSSNTYYIVRYFGEQANATDTTITVSYSTVVTQTNFSGVVTFSGGTLTDGSSSFDPAGKISTAGALADIYANYSAEDDTTHIDGGYIKTNTVDASQLVVSANTDGTADSIYMGNGVIKIYGSNGSTAVLRVKIGNLSA